MNRKPPYISDTRWVAEWKAFITRFPGLPAPTDRILKRHQQPQPRCIYCWDTGLCPDCLGEHPQYCPSPECQGYCACPAGQAHKAAYDKSLKDFGLA